MQGQQCWGQSARTLGRWGGCQPTGNDSCFVHNPAVQLLTSITSRTLSVQLQRNSVAEEQEEGILVFGPVSQCVQSHPLSFNNSSSLDSQILPSFCRRKVCRYKAFWFLYSTTPSSGTGIWSSSIWSSLHVSCRYRALLHKHYNTLC